MLIKLFFSFFFFHFSKTVLFYFHNVCNMFSTHSASSYFINIGDLKNNNLQFIHITFLPTFWHSHNIIICITGQHTYQWISHFSYPMAWGLKWTVDDNSVLTQAFYFSEILDL